MTDGAAARRRDRLADRPFALAAAARALAAPATASPATTSRSALPPEDFASGLRGAAGARLPRRERHDPAQGGGAGAGRPTASDARGADRGGQHAHLRRRTAAIHADNTDGYGFVANLRQEAPGWSAGGRAGAGARRRRRGARGRRGAARRGRAGGPRSPTAPAPAPRRCATHFGAADRRRSTGREAAAAAADAATIVNTTSLGMAGAAGAAGPPRRARRRPRWSPTSSTAAAPTPFARRGAARAG